MSAPGAPDGRPKWLVGLCGGRASHGQGAATTRVSAELNSYAGGSVLMPQGDDRPWGPWCCGCVSGNRLCLKKQGPRAGAGPRGPSTSGEFRTRGRGVPTLWAFQNGTRLVNKAPSPLLSLCLQMVTSLMGTGGRTWYIHSAGAYHPAKTNIDLGGGGGGKVKLQDLVQMPGHSHFRFCNCGCPGLGLFVTPRTAS